MTNHYFLFGRMWRDAWFSEHSQNSFFHFRLCWWVVGHIPLHNRNTYPHLQWIMKSHKAPAGISASATNAAKIYLILVVWCVWRYDTVKYIGFSRFYANLIFLPGVQLFTTTGYWQLLTCFWSFLEYWQISIGKQSLRWLLVGQHSIIALGPNIVGKSAKLRKAEDARPCWWIYTPIQLGGNIEMLRYYLALFEKELTYTSVHNVL